MGDFDLNGGGSLPVVVGSEDDEHAIVSRSGRFECVGCGYDSLNRWGAEAHYEEHHGEPAGADKPGWF